MKVAKWGNSLAVRIPVDVAESLNLKDGDQVEIRTGGDKMLILERDQRRQKALERLRQFQIEFPADYKFDRDEANAR